METNRHDQPITTQGNHPSSLVGAQQKPLAERVQEAARSAADAVEDSVDTIRTTSIDQLAEQAGQKGAELGANVSSRVDEAMTTAGEQISQLGQAVREHAPSSGTPGEIVRSAADNIERSGEYLQNADMSQVRRDLEQLIRSHPIEALVVGAGIGYLAAKAMRR